MATSPTGLVGRNLLATILALSLGVAMCLPTNTVTMGPHEEDSGLHKRGKTTNGYRRPRYAIESGNRVQVVNEKKTSEKRITF